MGKVYTFYFEFLGRELLAIGSIANHYIREVKGENYKEALNKLYDTHEHIQVLHWTQWDEGKLIGGKNYDEL